jgi:hypothetical protein
MDQETIKQAIGGPTPFFIGRTTDVELRTAYDLHRGDLIRIQQDQIELENNAGIHIQKPASLHTYVQRFIQAYEHCTHIAIWEKGGGMYQSMGRAQEWILQRAKNTPRLTARSLEPYYFQDSWMPALKGKRILIVHPFVATFQKQYQKRAELFPNRSWFEDCSIQFIKPPMTMAGNHGNKDWQEHMDIFFSDIQGVEFDVALVAAGGYGMLIADYIYTNMRRSVMYIGGALQIFFGVIGKRWFDNKEIRSLITDDWVRPANEERPPNHTRVEKGCYW